MANSPIYQQQVGGVGGGFQPDRFADPAGMRVPLTHQVGDALGGMAKLAQQYQDDLDSARVFERLNDLKRYAQDQRTGENGYLKLRGGDALAKDEQGFGLAERADQSLKDYAATLQDGLTSKQRKLFDRGAGAVYNQQYAFASQHVMQQADEYALGQDKGTITNATQLASQNIGNPDLFGESIGDAIIAQSRINRRAGLSPEAATAAINGTAGRVAYEAALSAMESAQTPDDKVKAASWVKETYGQFMTGPQLADLTKRLNAAGDDVTVRTVGDEAVSALLRDPGSINVVSGASAGVPAYVTAENIPGEAVRQFEFIAGQESGGRQLDEKGNTLVGRYADGSTPKDGEKAYGVAQMQIGTAKDAAKAAGIPWDENAFMRDRQYNYNLGQAWFEQLLKAYDGDTRKAIVAYNQGKGNVNKAVKAAEAESKKTGKPVDWLSLMSATAQGYYADVSARASRGLNPEPKGADGKPISFFAPNGEQARALFKTVPTEKLRSWIKQAHPELASRPDLVDRIVDDYHRKESEKARSFETEQANLRATITEDYILQGKRYEDIPTEIRSRLTYGQQQEVRGMIAKLARGDSTGDEWLLASMKSDPNRWASLSESDMRSTLLLLPEDSRKTMEREWYGLNAQAKVKGTAIADMQSRARNGEYIPAFASSPDVVRSALKTAMGDLWPKNDAMQNLLVSNAMTAIYDAGVDRGAAYKSAQDILGSPELNAVGVNLFRTMNFWRLGAGKNPFTMTYGDLPNKGATDARYVLQSLANNELKRRGYHRTASEAEVMAYFRKLVIGRPLKLDEDIRGVHLDQTQIDYYRKHFSETDSEMLRRYIRDAVAGTYVKAENRPSLVRGNADAFLDSIERAQNIEGL